MSCRLHPSPSPFAHLEFENTDSVIGADGIAGRSALDPEPQRVG